MSLLKRIRISLFSRLEDVVSDIENHDAIIEAAIDEQSKLIASAKVQLLHLKRKLGSVCRQLEDCKTEEQRWRERAITESANNESRALECLKRKKVIEKQMNNLRLSEKEYKDSVNKLSEDIRRSELELKDFKQKQDLLRARESSAQVNKNFNQPPGSNLRQMEKTFDRWEANLCETSTLSTNESYIDNFEQDYLDKESEAELRQELEQLSREEINKGGTDHE